MSLDRTEWESMWYEIKNIERINGVRLRLNLKSAHMEQTSIVRIKDLIQKVTGQME